MSKNLISKVAKVLGNFSKALDFLEEESLKQSYKNQVDYEYIKLCKKILNEGVYRKGRNGGTLSIFGAQVRFDLSKGLPMLTTKKIVTRSVIHELVWLLKGDTSAKYLKDNNVGIWDLWIDEKGDLPYTYPRQWRRFPNPHGEPVDQIARAIEDIKNNPSSRRIIVSAWNPAEMDKAALPACHSFFQFFVADGKLSCHILCRSQDIALGTPFNWLSYALLTHVVAHICNLQVGDLVWTGGDVHIYENQIEALKTQFDRKSHELPKVKINQDLKNIDDFKFEDISIEGYVSEGFIKIPVSQ